MLISVNEIIPVSEANGVGKRFVIWTQGCNLRCEGCFNPLLWKFEGGTTMSAKTIAQAIPDEVEGITLTGGEPLLQDDLLQFLKEFNEFKPDLSVIIITGFNPDEFDQSNFEGLVDVMIAGRFEKDKKIASNLRGSSNKEYLFLSDRYTLSNFEDIPKSEVIIDGDNMTATGMIDSKELQMID